MCVGFNLLETEASKQLFSCVLCRLVMKWSLGWPRNLLILRNVFCRALELTLCTTTTMYILLLTHGL